MEQKIHTVIFKSGESDQWIAVCLELDVVTQGGSAQHALKMIREAFELHVEDMTKEDLDVLYQPIDGDPQLHEVVVSAPALLRR